MEQTEDLLRRLRGARAGSGAEPLSWLDVGRIVDAGQRLSNDPIAFRRTAAEACGHSESMIRRYVLRTAFVDQMHRYGTQLPADVLARSFTAIELIERIYNASPRKAERLYFGLLEGPSRIWELREILAGLGNSDQAHHPASEKTQRRRFEALERSARRKWAYNALASLLETTSGSGFTLRSPKGTNTITRCAYVAVQSKSAPPLHDGFDMAYLPSRVGAAEIHDLVARSILTGSFFRRFYAVMLPGTDERNVAAITRTLDWAAVGNVGVIAWSEGHGGVVRPVTGPPEPDRRHRLHEILVAGRWASPEALGEDGDGVMDQFNK